MTAPDDMPPPTAENYCLLCGQRNAPGRDRCPECLEREQFYFDPRWVDDGIAEGLLPEIPDPAQVGREIFDDENG